MDANSSLQKVPTFAIEINEYKKIGSFKNITSSEIDIQTNTYY